MAQPKGYSRVQIILHWVAAALIVLQFVLHEGISDAYDVATQTGVYAFSAPVIGHIAGGALILLLACWRLILRNDRGAPPPPAGEPEMFRKAGHVAHMALYALMIGYRSRVPWHGAARWRRRARRMR